MLALNGRYLVLPDVHQNLPWTEAVLSEEVEDVDGVVFLGDYFDAKIDNPPSAYDTAAFFARLESRLEKPVTFLVGNHDLPYLYDLQEMDTGPRGGPNPYPCSNYDPSKSAQIHRAWPASFRSRLKCLALVNGNLLSHAGLHPSHLPVATEATLESLDAELQRNLRDMLAPSHPAFASVSPVRGGFDPVGGITWLDWRYEFEDGLPWPQIVGHTALEKPQQNGRSWNLDTKGKHYAILDSDTVDIRAV